MSIYSNDNIRKIAKLTTRELPQKSKNAKITVRENNGVYSNRTCEKLKFILLSTVRAPVFGRHQLSASQSITEKSMEVYYLDEWIIITLHVAGFLLSSNILILPSQFWQISIESCWLHCSKCRILVLLRYSCLLW